MDKNKNIESKKSKKPSPEVQKYINEFNRKNYKIICVRFRKNDKFEDNLHNILIGMKKENKESLNSYIKNLIIQDLIKKGKLS